jgi:hypothetical protein
MKTIEKLMKYGKFYFQNNAYCFEVNLEFEDIFSFMKAENTSFKKLVSFLKDACDTLIL